jgi:hypothetical protein
MLVFALLTIISIAPISIAVPQTTSPPSEFLLEYGKAGIFEIGMTVDEVYNFAGRANVKLVDLFLEGMPAPALEIQVTGLNTGPSIIAEIGEWPCKQLSVWRIKVHDRRFQTKEGLGIGSTLGEIRRHYKVKPMGMAESDKMGVHVPSLHMTFVLDALAYDEPPDSAKVTAVLVIMPAKEVRRRRCPEP